MDQSQEEIKPFVGQETSGASLQPPISTSSPDALSWPNGNQSQEEQINGRAAHYQEGDSDFIGNQPTEERLAQERAELIDVFLKMKQGIATHESVSILRHFPEEFKPSEHLFNFLIASRRAEGPR